MKRYILILLLACCMQSFSQNEPRATFTPPFDFPLTLSGNFGEIRANHFHGGLDFKTGGETGKPVRALADGYISRIRVTHGSGYVLDVNYDNGYFTINRHLNGFLGPIAQRIEDLQYKEENYEVEIIPEPGEYPVKAGQQIAWSGNKGYSFGPHLHLDMFESVTGDYIDPIPFFLSRIKDTTAPRTEGIMLFPQAGMGVVEGKQKQSSFSPAPVKPVEAWGVVGAGIKAYDYMDGVHNRYGVKTVILSVDGKEVFRSQMDRFSQEENRMINSWTCGQYMKSFIEPGNTLRFLKASNDNRGLITIDEERDYQLEYTLKDAFGNTSHCRFTIRGKKQPIEPLQHSREKYFFAWDKMNFLQEPGLTLVVPKGTLYDDVALNYQMKADSGAIAFTYQLNEVTVPLHTPCELRIGLRRMPVTDTTKYYVARVTPKGLYGAGGQYEDGFMKTQVRELATYTVAIDTIPPVITPVNPKNWGRSGKVVYTIKDKSTGIRSYRGSIDGKYALFGRPNMTRSQYVCELNPKRMKKGGKHIVEMIATDDCGNETVVRDTFIW